VAEERVGRQLSAASAEFRHKTSFADPPALRQHQRRVRQAARQLAWEQLMIWAHNGR